MKKFLAVSLIFLIGLMFLGLNGYAEESKAKSERQFFFVFMQGVAHNNVYSSNYAGIGTVYVSKSGKFFSDSNFVVFHSDSNNEFSLFSLRWNWILLGGKLEKRILRGVYAGFGLNTGKIQEEDDYGTIINGHVGLRVMAKFIYGDIRLNLFPLSSERRRDFKCGLSLALGLIF